MAQSSFAKFIRHDPLTGEDAEARNLAIGRQAYHDSGGEVMILFRSLIPGEWEQAAAESIAISLYGKRKT